MLTLDRDGLKDRAALKRDEIQAKVQRVKERRAKLGQNELLTSGLAVLPLAGMVLLEARDTLKFGDVSMTVYQADDERKLGIWRFEYNFSAPCGNHRLQYKWSIASDYLGQCREVKGMGKELAEQFMAEAYTEARKTIPPREAP